MHFIERLLTPSTLPQGIVTAAVLLSIAYVIGMMVKQNTKYALLLCLAIIAMVVAISVPNAVVIVGAAAVVIAAFIWL